MAWNPKTAAGKLLKGALQAGGTVLGTVTGLNVLGGVAKTVSNVVTKGTTALSKVSTVLSNARTASDKVAESAGNLVTGYTTKVNEATNQAKTALRNDVLMATGEMVVNNQEGILTTEKSKFNLSELIKSPIVKYGLIAVAGLLILPKLLKR